MSSVLIRNARMVNEGTTIVSGQITWHDKRLNVCSYGLCDKAR